MPVTLITGPHQSGKTRRLWQRLRALPPGGAVLVRPTAGLPNDLVRQVHGWFGAGLLPPVWSFAELVERCAAGGGVGIGTLGPGAAASLLRAWGRDGLATGAWRRLAGFRSTAVELAELCQRLDDHLVGDADLELAARTLRGRGETALASGLVQVAAARRHLALTAAGRGLATPGARQAAIAAEGGAPAFAAVHLDDFLALSPAELAVLRALAQTREVVVTAVDDPRLGGGGFAERLRAAFPGAAEERLPGIHAQAALPAALRGVLRDALVEGLALPAALVSSYAYRDPWHAGRAIAAQLRRGGIAPDQAVVYVRACDGEALALADALIAAEVPVAGRFQVPLLATAAGACLAAAAAWTRSRSWGDLLQLAGCALSAQRAGIALRLPAGEPPLRLADLAGPFTGLSTAEGLARLARLAAEGVCDGWGWRERDDRGRPWLRAAAAWLAAFATALPRAERWGERWRGTLAALGLDQLAGEVGRGLDERAAFAETAPEDVDELLAAARVEVRRGDPAARGALLVADAVRGRSWPRPWVFIHGLEHGRWPAQPGAGALLPPEDRRLLAGALDRDVYDEDGRRAGETASLLAVMARAGERVVLGVPCGEREPSQWLATLASQLGWELERLRARPAADAVPGAPLGPHDSQGAHERALWGQPAGRPGFALRVPPRPAGQLGLKLSTLGAVFHDAFALVCERLALGDPLYDRERMELGTELHALLAELAPLLPSEWVGHLDGRLPGWVAAGPDALARVERRRTAAAVREAIAAEAAAVVPLLGSAAERRVEVPIPVPGHELLTLAGTIDRLDRVPDGGVRVVDYKLGAASRYAQALRDGAEAQVLGYLAGLQAAGERVEAAYYLSLADGRRAGFGALPGKGGKGVDLAEAGPRLAALGAAIARLAEGEAVADPEAGGPYAPIARSDEARLDLGGEAAEGEP